MSTPLPLELLFIAGAVASVRQALAECEQFRLRACASVDEALTLLGEPNAIDAILIGLDAVNGQNFRAFQRLHERASHLPVLAVVESDDGELPLRLIQAGAQDCLIAGVDDAQPWTRAVRYAVERNHYRQGLRVSEQTKLRKLVEQVVLGEAEQFGKLGSWCMDLPSGQLIWSDGTCRLFGIEPGTFPGTYEAFLEFLLPEYRAVVSDAIRRAEAESGILETEYRIHRPDGALRWMYVRGRIERDSAGKPVRRIGMILDITDRKEAEMRLLAEREILQRIFDHVPVLLCFIAPGGRMELCNREFERVLGWSLAEIQNHPDIFSEFYPDPQERERVIAFIEAGERIFAEFSCRARSGEQIPVSFANVLLSDGTSVGIGLDLRERRRSEEALRVSEERFRLVARATNDAVWDWDLLTNMVWWNDGYEVLFGFPREEITPTADAWLAGIHPEDRQRVHDEIFHAIESGATSWAGEYRFHRKDGSFADVYDRGFVIHDSTGRPVRMIGGMIDVTDRKRLEEQLRQSQKMEAIGQLAGGVAHDFNNLLTVINGYCELLLDQFPVDDPRRPMMREVRDAGERAADLTRQLLAFSRKQILAPQIVNLNRIVSNIDTMLRRLIGEDIYLASVLQPNLSLVQVDPGQIEQVIVNLAVNARDAMPRGGHLTIETFNVQLDEAAAGRKLDCRPGPYVALTVSDTGQGMPPEVADRVFEPFFTTKEPGKGTGLGLATVFGIIKQSGGWIDVYSEVGVGTRFKILFPAVVATPADPAHPYRDAPTGTETILVVEDEESVRRVARLALEEFGYRVLEARNGKEAIRVLELNPVGIDLVLTDVVMPELNGRSLVEYLRTHRPEVKVLFMSGYTDDAVVRHGILEATEAFLQKPFSPMGLACKVREVLDARPPNAPN